MSQLVLVNLDALRASKNDTLYFRVVRQVNQTKGTYPIDLGKLYWEDSKALIEFLEEQAIKARVEREDEEERQRKIEADKRAGEARLLQYVRERDLENSVENSKAIFNFLKEHPQIKGVVTPATIDIAISHLGPKGRNTLRWVQKAPVTPPPPPPPEIRYLDNGEQELPLNASNAEKRRASIPQLRDLSKRLNEGRQTWRHGWTGTNL